MGHDVRQSCGYDETAQVDHAGSFPDNHQHFVGQAPGQSCLGENHAYDYRGEDEHHRGVHEVIESFFGRTNKEKDLEYAYGQAGYSHWHYFEDPPD